MAYWRMAMRYGTGGEDLWPVCRQRGIAAMGYWDERGRNIVGDCRKTTLEQYDSVWKRRDPGNTSGRASLRHLAYSVKPGDIIYVKSGSMIVGRGTVTAGYRFDPSVLGDIDGHWAHIVGVRWERGFKPVPYVFRDAQHTLRPVAAQDVKTIEEIIAGKRNAQTTVPATTTVDAPPDAPPTTSRGSGDTGAGFGLPESNRQVEEAAVAVVTRYYRKRGWTVRSVEAERCGYDLKCVRSAQREHVEVKGISGSECSFVMTANEIRLAGEDPRFVLLAVTGALGPVPRLRRWAGHDIRHRFEAKPLAYKLTLRD